MPQASGTFEVRLAPQKPDNKEAESANLGRMSIDKRFNGDLDDYDFDYSISEI